MLRRPFLIGARFENAHGVGRSMSIDAISERYLVGLPVSTASGPAIELPDANTMLQLSMDGADTSTSFPDDAIRHTVTANGDAQVDTAQKKFGTGSLLLDGTGDYLDIPDNADFEYGGNAFTMECFVRLPAISGRPVIIDKSTQTGGGASSGYAFWFDFGSSQGLNFTVKVSGGSQVATYQGSNAGWSVDTWYHVAVDRSGNDFRVYRDGTVLGTHTVAHTIADRSENLRIGDGGFDGQGTDFNGWIDELRISDVARYAGAFTAPSKSF